MSTESLTIKQAAEATGLSVHTLRYYEGLGLIHPIDRAGNTHRRYTREDIGWIQFLLKLGWIQFLLKLRATGMSIQDMQTYAELQRQGDETLQQRVAMLKAPEREVEAHIAELSGHLDLIRYKIALYSEPVLELA